MARDASAAPADRLEQRGRTAQSTARCAPSARPRPGRRRRNRRGRRPGEEGETFSTSQVGRVVQTSGSAPGRQHTPQTAEGRRHRLSAISVSQEERQQSASQLQPVVPLLVRALSLGAARQTTHAHSPQGHCTSRRRRHGSAKRLRAVGRRKFAARTPSLFQRTAVSLRCVRDHRLPLQENRSARLPRIERARARVRSSRFCACFRRT